VKTAHATLTKVLDAALAVVDVAREKLDNEPTIEAFDTV
jgi:hypothetical protein